MQVGSGGLSSGFFFFCLGLVCPRAPKDAHRPLCLGADCGLGRGSEHLAGEKVYSRASALLGSIQLRIGLDFLASPS